MARQNESTGGFAVHLLSAAVFYLTLCAIFVPLIASIIGSVGLWTALLMLPCFAFGYLASQVFSLLLGFKRKKNTNSYESEVGYFEPHKAALPIILSVILSVVYGYPIAMILMKLSELSDLSYFGNASIIAFAAVCAVTGAVVWFFPAERLCSEKTCLVFGCIMLAAFIIYGYMGMQGSVILLFLVLLIPMALFALGQNALSLSNSEGTVSFVNPRARRQYAAVSLLMLLLLAVCFVVTASVFSGVIVLFKTFLFQMLAPKEGDDQYLEYTLGNTVEMYNNFVYGKNEATSSPMFYFFIIFVILSVIGIFYLALRRSKEVRLFFSELWRGLVRFFKAIIDFLSGRRGEDELYTVAVSYRDIEKKISEPKMGTAVRSRRRVRSYKSFVGELDSLVSVDEKLVYSYVTLVGILRNMQFYIKQSDTPREICEKIKSSPAFSEIPGLTEAFEQVSYAGRGLGEENGGEAVKTMCRMIRAHMED